MSGAGLGERGVCRGLCVGPRLWRALNTSVSIFQGMFNRCYRGCESVQIKYGEQDFYGARVGAGRVNSVLPVEGSIFITRVDRLCRANQRHESPNRARLNTSHVCQRNPLFFFHTMHLPGWYFSEDSSGNASLPLGRFRLAKNIIGHVWCFCFFLSPLWNKMEDGWAGKKLEGGKAANGDSCWRLLAKHHLIETF